MAVLFRDRRAAGRQLAQALRELLGEWPRPAPVVLALPRGGVPVASEVADAFDAPLGVVVARKIGAPGRPEVGVGAIVGEEPPLFDYAAMRMLDLTPDELATTVAHERTELHRREWLYGNGRPAPVVTGRTAILVDDGLATGVTARAAARLVRARRPARLVLAVPVGDPRVAADLHLAVDHLLCLHRPSNFQAVGSWYEDFGQMTDQEVIDSLDRQEAGSRTVDR